MASRKHTHASCNAVLLVRGSLRVAPITSAWLQPAFFQEENAAKRESYYSRNVAWGTLAQCETGSIIELSTLLNYHRPQALLSNKFLNTHTVFNNVITSITSLGFGTPEIHLYSNKNLRTRQCVYTCTSQANSNFRRCYLCYCSPRWAWLWMLLIIPFLCFPGFPLHFSPLK